MPEVRSIQNLEKEMKHDTKDIIATIVLFVILTIAMLFTVGCSDPNSPEILDSSLPDIPLSEGNWSSDSDIRTEFRDGKLFTGFGPIMYEPLEERPFTATMKGDSVIVVYKFRDNRQYEIRLSLYYHPESTLPYTGRQIGRMEIEGTPYDLHASFIRN